MNNSRKINKASQTTDLLELGALKVDSVAWEGVGEDDLRDRSCSNWVSVAGMVSCSASDCSSFLLSALAAWGVASNDAMSWWIWYDKCKPKYCHCCQTSHWHKAGSQQTIIEWRSPVKPQLSEDLPRLCPKQRLKVISLFHCDRVKLLTSDLTLLQDCCNIGKLSSHHSADVPPNLQGFAPTPGSVQLNPIHLCHEMCFLVGMINRTK